MGYLTGTLNDAVRELVIAHSSYLGAQSTTEQVVSELVEMKYKHTVWESPREDYEWWTEFEVVVKVGDRFIALPQATTSGGRAPDEAGWRLNLSAIRFVERREKVVVFYE